MDLDAVVSSLLRHELRGVFVDPIEASNLSNVTRLKNSATTANLLFSQHLGAQRIDVHRDLSNWIESKLFENSDKEFDFVS